MLGSGEDVPSQPDKSFVPETQRPCQDLLSVSCVGYFVPLLQPRALNAGTSVKAVWSQACLGLPHNVDSPAPRPESLPAGLGSRAPPSTQLSKNCQHGSIPGQERSQLSFYFEL